MTTSTVAALVLVPVLAATRPAAALSAPAAAAAAAPAVPAVPARPAEPAGSAEPVLARPAALALSSWRRPAAAPDRHDRRLRLRPQPGHGAGGNTVTWTNTGERPHTATDRGGTFDTQPSTPAPPLR